MNFDGARDQLELALSTAPNSFEEDFVGQSNSPCGVLSTFRDTRSSSDSPILRDYESDVAERSIEYRCRGPE
jgi:hypothetical protein